MGVHLYAGALISWAVLYAVATAFCIWAGRRPGAEPGAEMLVRLTLLLMITASFAGLSLVIEAPAIRSACTYLAMATTFPVPLFIDEYFRERNATTVQRRSGFWFEVGIVVALVVAAGLGFMHDDAGQLSTAGRASTFVFAILVIIAVLRLGEVMRRELGLGPLTFAGGLLLAVAAVYDAALAAADVPHAPTVHAGFIAFALALLAGQISRIGLLREHLLAEQEDLRSRSDAVGVAFRDLRVRQAELVRKEQLAAVGELAAVIAHEVRNPLAIIMNAVSSLKRHPADKAQTDTLFEILTEETTRLNRIVGDLLHYARPLSPAAQSVDVVEVVERAVSHVTENPNVDIEVSTKRTNTRIVGDPVLVRQAIDNVLHNALQAMGSGGHLRVRVRATLSGKDGVEVLIRDTGEGMDTVVRKRALDPFFTTRPTGTGLGLAIVARVVDAHGGRLSIQSERGAGTEVRIFLPRDVSELANPRSTAPHFLPVIEPFRANSSPDEEETGEKEKEAS